MTKDEALKLALVVFEYPGNIWHMNCPKDKAITAIKEALAQPEQEPSELDVWKVRALQAEAVIKRFMAQPEQHQDWCASLTQLLASMPPQPAPCNCKPAQPEQEPAALVEKFSLLLWDYQELERAFEKATGGKWIRKSNTPQSEPVIDKSAAIRIATALGWEPKRAWVGLSDEELAEFSEAKLGAYDLCLEVEAKLKEKNNG